MKTAGQSHSINSREKGLDTEVTTGRRSGLQKKKETVTKKCHSEQRLLNMPFGWPFPPKASVGDILSASTGFGPEKAILPPPVLAPEKVVSLFCWIRTVHPQKILNAE